jgi:hypothetical protein
MLEAQKCFAYLIEKSQKLPSLTPEQRKLIQGELQYFHKQSLTDEDRRHRQEVIRNHWLQFERKTRFTSLLLEPPGFFAVIYEFTGVTREMLVLKREQSEFDKWEPQDFFTDLLKEFEAKKHFFSETENDIVSRGLKFILNESKIAKIKRDAKGVLKTWRAVRPVLEKYGFFYKYKGANLLSSRLRLFLTGSD